MFPQTSSAVTSHDAALPSSVTSSMGSIGGVGSGTSAAVSASTAVAIAQAASAAIQTSHSPSPRYAYCLPQKSAG